MSNKHGQCWICGTVGPLTSEHGLNQADLRDIFGEVTQRNPVYFHRDDAFNKPIGSLNAKDLKSEGTLCAACNNALTQPHDLGFYRFRRALVDYLAQHPDASQVRLSTLVKHNTRKVMLDVHLHFAKKLGEYVVTTGAPIDLAPLAAAIKSNTPHPRLHLSFGTGPTADDGTQFTGRTPIEFDHERPGASDVRCAMYMAGYDGLIVLVAYAQSGEQREGLVNAWHPKGHGAKFVTIKRFRGDEPQSN